MKLSIFHSKLASIGLASVIAVGVIGVGSVAMAQTPDGGTPTSRDAGGRHHPKFALKIGELLKNSGVTREELKQGVEADMTLGQILDQYGDISAAQAKEQALANLSTRLDEAVANGEITQEQADRIEAAAPGIADRILNMVPGQHRGDGNDGHPKLRAITKSSLETVARVLDTDVRSIVQQLKDGKTIAEIAGPQTQDVIDALTHNANEAIDKAVADGTIPADKADAAKAKAAQAIDWFVNSPHPRAGGHGN